VPYITPEKEFELTRTQAVLFELSNYSLVEVFGDDAIRYLNGRVTQDIKNFAIGEGKKSLLLSPQGRIEAHFLILRDEDKFIFIIDPSDTNFEEALFRFRVADAVEGNNNSELYKLYSLQGPSSSEILNSFGFKKLPEHPYQHAVNIIENISYRIIFHPRGEMQGFDIIIPQNQVQTFINQMQKNKHLILGSKEGLELVRISTLTPRYDLDLKEKIFAPDINLSELASFSKGCYTGQEVVEMATARGKPNRKFRLLIGNSLAQIPSGADVFAKIESIDKKVGFATSSAMLPSLGKTMCLSFLKFDTDEESTPLIIEGLEFSVLNGKEIE
jgi:folate-binding protein YgfZ